MIKEWLLFTCVFNNNDLQNGLLEIRNISARINGPAVNRAHEAHTWAHLDCAIAKAMLLTDGLLEN